MQFFGGCNASLFTMTNNVVSIKYFEAFSGIISGYLIIKPQEKYIIFFKAPSSAGNVSTKCIKLTRNPVNPHPLAQKKGKKRKALITKTLNSS